MKKVIIHPNLDCGICVVVPAPACGLSIEQIAAKDVPTGIPYKIVDITEVPTDRTFRDAWEADFTTYDGVGD